MKKKLKKFLIILTLIIVIALVIVVFVNRKKKVIVNDYTTGELANANAQNSETADSSDRNVSTDDVKATINKYVKIPTEEEAQKVNAGITSISSDRLSDTTIITMNSMAREVFDSYGKGDVFILDGDENTPFKEVYFGKIASKYTNSNGDLIVEVEDPAIDEIFDELSVNSEGLITEKNVRNIQLEEGVSLRWVDDIDSEFEQTAYSGDNNFSTDLTRVRVGDESIIGPIQKLGEVEIGGKVSFIFDFDLGLTYDIASKKFTQKASAELGHDIEKNFSLSDLETAELLGIDDLKIEASSKEENVDHGMSYEKSHEYINGTTTTKKETDSGNYTIVKDKNGTIIPQNEVENNANYVNKTAEQITKEELNDKIRNYTTNNTTNTTANNVTNTTAEKEKIKRKGAVEESKSIQAVNKFLDTLESNGKLDSTISVSLSGKAGFDELSSNVVIDYSLFDGGFKTVNCGFTGSALAEIEAKAELSVEIGGKKTKFEIPNISKIEGLQKKLIPLAYIDASGTPVAFGGIYSYLETVPLCAGFLVYMDFNGNINLCAKAKAGIYYDFDCNVDVFKDGKFLNDVTFNDNLNATFEFNALASLSARADLFGVSAIVSVANVTVCEIGVIDLYFDVEAQAEFKAIAVYGTGSEISAKNSQTSPKDKGWTKDVTGSINGFGGLYVDIGTLKVNLKFVTLPGTRHSKTRTIESDLTLLTIPIWEFGNTKTKTELDPSGSYTEVSAMTDKYEFYRDSNGGLNRINKKTKTTATYDIDDFVLICGLDKSYIYLLQKRKRR